MPKKVSQPSSLGELLQEQTASTRASLDKNPTIDSTIRQRGGVVPERHSRKKTTINRKKARTIFFDDKAWSQLDNASYNNRINAQRIVQTAIAEFFSKYYDTKNEKINQDGLNLIARYEESITL